MKKSEMTVFDMNRNANNLMKTDCYNTSHQMLKINTDFEVSHLYNRTKKQVLFLFSHIVKEFFGKPITKEWVEEAHKSAKDMGLVFPRELFDRVVNEFNGYMPIHIESLPDGTICPAGTPFAQISNTVEGFGDIVSWFEGVLMKAYYPSGCMTEAYEMYKYLKKIKEERNYDESFMSRFHSFGYRGHASEMNALMAGLAWSTLFQGTDDFHIRQFMPSRVRMGSISALAHKVTQQFDNELDCFIHAIDKQAKAVENGEGQPVIALVIDTYDAWNFIDNYFEDIVDHARLKGIHIVCRPDSGRVLDQAIAIYRWTRELGASNVSVIIGEGMSFEKAKEYDETLDASGVPLTFVSYGIGAGFYKHIDRDFLGYAMKTSFSNGDNRMKFSEVEVKQSIPGLVMLTVTNNMNMMVDYENEFEDRPNLYTALYHFDGIEKLPNTYYFTIEETRNNILSEIHLEETYGEQKVILKSDAVKAEIERIRELHNVN